ncbi:MAG: hypothetical protein ACOY94_24760 [Bacillota bacterium]
MMLMWIIPLLLLIFLLVDRPQSGQGTRSVALVLLVLLGLPLIGMVFMGGGMHGGGWMHGGGMMHGYRGEWGWNWWNLAGGLFMLAGLGALGYALFRRGGADSESEELRILKLRLAKGEISTEEYDLLRQKLSG